ncbi:rhodanese-like domain-containing protein [Salinibacillus xinjiangensis]|uniref:Rhodanese-like domain-containing protein n=1 Tax=Salinibacillus xinjiangensis TaxID=1229268 RepID=A0A6G1X2R7_9BACI|nr:rhodanese-like domain-containing protein [Salinibacillus xinjiangensis]MRG85232.1 rhodanese-like domain-containing protein [Salinibacillus xinjiangensis]
MVSLNGYPLILGEGGIRVSEEVKEITPEELEEHVGKDTYTIIDVRENEEVEQGMIEGAKHIPLQQIPESLDQLDKEKEYVMVCRSGRRSYNASLYLQEHGYKVRNMVGGMLNWSGEVVF